MLYVFGAMFAVILALGGVASCEHKRANTLEIGIEANKAQAKLILDAETAKVAAKEKADKEFSVNIQADYDQSLKDLAAKYQRELGRLRDPGRNGGACAPSGSGANPGKPNETADAGQLSTEASTFLYGEAKRADELRLWANTCYKFVNQKPEEAKPEPKPTLTERIKKAWGN